MGLVNKLTELDEYVWKQYEKVTQYCNKEFGWNKYDLARLSNSAENYSFIGAGLYTLVEGFDGQSNSNLLAGSSLIILSVINYYLGKKKLEKNEKKEEKWLENSGVAKPIIYNPWRPLSYGFVALNLHAAYSNFTEKGLVPEGLTLSHGEYHKLHGMVNALISTWFFFIASRWYFEDQIMTPPKKKKSLFKTMYDKVTGKLPAVPQLESVNPTKYRSIDDVVGGA